MIYRGYGTGGVDFLNCQEKWDHDILTNPPYKYAQEFVEHALEIVSDGSKVFMLLRLLFLESKKRRKLFDSGCLKTVYVFSGRILCSKGGKFDKAEPNAIAYAWFEFQKGYKGSTTIKWIN